MHTLYSCYLSVTGPVGKRSRFLQETMNSRHHIIPVIIAVVTTFLPLSCIRESSRGDAFEAAFSLDTPTVWDGDELVFSVRTNRGAFRLVEFSFPLSPRLLETGKSYPVTDGAWTYRGRIPVPATQRGRISLTVEDPETGLRKEFSESYTAYASTGVNLEIGNPPVGSECLPEGIPAIISGDDFVLTLRSRAPRLILCDFDFELNDGTLSIGKEFLFTDNACTVTIPSVSVGDAFTPKTLSLCLLDPDSGRDTTVTVPYLTAGRFAPEVTITPEVLSEGGTATVWLTSNRESFELRGYSAPSWFTLEGYSPDSPGVTLGLDGYAAFTTAPLSISSSASGEIRFDLLDSRVTLRSVLLSVPYTAAARPVPGDVTLSASSFRLRTDETAEVSVGTTTAGSTGRFTATVLSGETGAVVIAPASPGETPRTVPDGRFGKECTITGGRLLLRGRPGHWGEVTVRVAAEGNDGARKDISVYVRRDVALRLKGDFRNYICWWPNQVDPVFSDLGNGSQGIGWWGIPYGVDAELVSWENRSGRELSSLKKEEVSTYLRCFSLTEPARAYLEPTFIVSVGNRVSSRFFYGTYRDQEDPRSRLLTGTDISRVTSATLPATLNSTMKESRRWAQRVPCDALLRLLQDLDCKADYQNGYGLFVMLRETLHSDDQLGFGSFDVSLKEVGYDRDRYALRYLFNFMEVPGEQGASEPWWSGVGGERPWITPWND